MKLRLLFDQTTMNKKPPQPKQSNEERLPAYVRAKQPPGLRLTERDKAILLTIYRYDGMVSVDQIHRWFFPGEANKRNAQRRISLLYHNGCIQRPTRQELYRVPEPIVWLDTTGAEEVVKQLDTSLDELHWRSTPRWSKVTHDLLLNEFRHTMEVATLNHPRYRLETWHGQDELVRLFAKPIPYLDQQGERKEKLVQPDGFFALFAKAEGENKGYRVPFLVELDNGTESNSRFGRDKVSPGVHLVYSKGYQTQLTFKTGRFLVIVAGSEQRFHNMRAEVTNAGGAAYFLFTRSVWANPATILAKPIWYFPHVDEPFCLEEYGTPAFQAYAQQVLATAPHLKLLHP